MTKSKTARKRFMALCLCLGLNLTFLSQEVWASPQSQGNYFYQEDSSELSDESFDPVRARLSVPDQEWYEPRPDHLSPGSEIFLREEEEGNAEASPEKTKIEDGLEAKEVQKQAVSFKTNQAKDEPEEAKSNPIQAEENEWEGQGEEPKPQPGQGREAKPGPGQDSEPKPEPKPKPAPGSEPNPGSKPEPGSEAKPEPGESNPEPGPKPEPKPTPTPKPEPKPEPGPEPGPQPQPEPIPEPQPKEPRPVPQPGRPGKDLISDYQPQGEELDQLIDVLLSEGPREAERLKDQYAKKKSGGQKLPDTATTSWLLPGLGLLAIGLGITLRFNYNR